MKKLFLYFSLTGNGDLVAMRLSENGFDLRKVIEKANAPKSFFFRVLFGGFRAGLRLKGKLIDYDPDVKDYEEIVIGSPVWNGLFPPAINAVLATTDLSGKKLTFLFYSGSGDVPKATKRVAKSFPNAQVIVLKEPQSHPQELKKLESLAK